MLDISLKRLPHGGQITNLIEMNHTVRYVFKHLTLTNESATISLYLILNILLEIHIGISI